MGPLCRGSVWMPITPKRGPFCTPIHNDESHSVHNAAKLTPGQHGNEATQPRRPIAGAFLRKAA